MTNRKRRKRNLLGAGTALVAALAFGLSGCNGETDPAPPADGPTTQPQAPGEETGGPTRPGDLPGAGGDAGNDWPAPGGDGP